MINEQLPRALALLLTIALAAACSSSETTDDPAASAASITVTSTVVESSVAESTETTAAPTTTTAPTTTALASTTTSADSTTSIESEEPGDELPVTLGLTIEEFIDRWNSGMVITAGETLIGTDTPAQPLDPRFETRVWTGLNAVGGAVVLTAYAEDGLIIDAAYRQPADAVGLGTIGFGRMLAAVTGQDLADLRLVFDEALENEGLGRIGTPVGDAIFCLSSTGAGGDAMIFVSANIPGC